VTHVSSFVLTHVSSFVLTSLLTDIPAACLSLSLHDVLQSKGDHVV
jgi:hypothetical protein